MNSTLLKSVFFYIFIATHLIAHGQSSSSATITTPKAHFGFAIGDNYHLTTYSQTEAYFKKLAQESPRIHYVPIGKTEEGRDQCMLIVSAPENLQNLEKYRQISTTLARATMDEQQARQLANDGKAIVWIDGGLHSNETVATHQLIETAYQLGSREDEETLHILDNTIVLLVHANPDGHELVSNWYMRNQDPEKRSLSNVPVLYQKYAGHDNNRDFFMLNLKESQNIAKQLFVEWNPQIMYNHHQTAPAGAVVAGAPYRDPFNYVFDPLLMSSIDAVGAAMSSRLNAEDKPGYTQKGGSVFSTWYNGGLRTTTYFHNMVGLLTEIIGGPNPFEIPLVPNRLIPSSNTQYPVLPQTWYFRNSIDYSVSLNYAVLSHASRYRNEVLYNIYKMGRNSIDKGNQDTWSLSPSKVALIDSAIAEAKRANPNLERQRFLPKELADTLFNDPGQRDARVYIVPHDQKDAVTAVRFINALIGNGIEVHVATEDFAVGENTYTQGSYVIKTNQAFRPHILDMFEPQDHPNDFQYPGGPPIPPYDAAGWTLAYLMHIQFDRYLEDVDGPFAALPIGEPVKEEEKTVPNRQKYIKISPDQNRAFSVANKSLNANQRVWRDETDGSWYVENKNLSIPTPLHYESVDRLPRETKAVGTARIALWDVYGGSMPSGWLRFILEQHDYPFTVVYPPEIDSINLNALYDVLILPGNAIPRQTGSRGGNMPTEVPDDIPLPYRSNWGRLSIEKSIPALRKFVENGGKIVTIGNSSVLASHFKVGVEDALIDEDGETLGRERYYTPGSVLTARVQEDHPSTWGYQDHIDLYFSNNDVFKITDADVVPLLWFDTDTPLKSGWSWGERYLKDGVIAFEKKVGDGKLTVFSTDITFRSQTHGTFRLLFNQLYNGL